MCYLQVWFGSVTFGIRQFILIWIDSVIFGIRQYSSKVAKPKKGTTWRDRGRMTTRRMNLSARGYPRVLMLVQTILDLPLYPNPNQTFDQSLRVGQVRSVSCVIFRIAVPSSFDVFSENILLMDQTKKTPGLRIPFGSQRAFRRRIKRRVSGTYPQGSISFSPDPFTITA